MRLSNLADYAVVMMGAAARHCGGSRTNAGELAAETGLPLPTVQKLVSKLTAAGLLRSTRGAGGGLQLARPAAAINLADIVEAVEGRSRSPPVSKARIALSIRIARSGRTGRWSMPPYAAHWRTSRWLNWPGLTKELR